MSAIALSADYLGVTPLRRPGAGAEITGEANERIRRVLIADDRARSRLGLRALLTTYPAIMVVGEAGDGQEAVRLVASLQPDSVVMDAKMPVMDGLTATGLIKERWPETKVIILTMYAVSRADALCSGADAFLVKGCPPRDLLAAILDYEERE